MLERDLLPISISMPNDFAFCQNLVEIVRRWRGNWNLVRLLFTASGQVPSVRDTWNRIIERLKLGCHGAGSRDRTAVCWKCPRNLKRRTRSFVRKIRIWANRWTVCFSYVWLVLSRVLSVYFRIIFNIKYLTTPIFRHILHWQEIYWNGLVSKIKLL